MDAEKIRRDIEMYVRSAVTGDERESICVEGLLALMLNVYGNGVADANRRLRHPRPAPAEGADAMTSDFDTLLDAALHMNDLLKIRLDHVEYEGGMSDVESFRELVNGLFAKHRLKRKEQTP